MTKFISLSVFGSFYRTPADLMDPEGLAAFRKQLHSDAVDGICTQYGISPADLAAFDASLEVPEHVLFYSWIIQSPALEELLSNGTLKTFEDRGGHLEHRLANDYRRFVSPYLAERLLHYTGSELQERVRAFSYAPLLDSDHSAVVETQLFASIRADVAESLAKAKTLKDENELIALIQPLCSDEIIACVNGLSRSMYATRLQYIDDVLSVIRMKACTARFANWLLKRMELITLNKEHAHKLSDLRGDLKQGSLTVRNNMEKGTVPIRWKRILTYVLLAALVGFAGWVIIYKPFNEVKPNVVADDTSFQQFTPDERERIDSLLKEMNGNRPEEVFYDPGIPIYGGGTNLVLRKAFNNQELERIYDDFSRDAYLQSAGYSDTCLRAISFKPLKGTEDLTQHSGALAAMFRNDSDYDIIVLVADNTSGGKVYSALIKSGDIEVLKMDVGNILMIVAGNTFQQYSAPQGVAQNELPSSDFTKHFCDTDMNYGLTINMPYEVTSINKGKTKFLINGGYGNFVDLVDIYGVLEPW